MNPARVMQRLKSRIDSLMQSHADEPDGGHGELAALLQEAHDTLAVNTQPVELQGELARAERIFKEALPREVILCPRCGLAHVDGASGAVFAHRPHHTHRCEHCTHEWPSGRWSFGALAPRPDPVKAVYMEPWTVEEDESAAEREVRALWPLVWDEIPPEKVPQLRVERRLVIGPQWRIAAETSFESTGETREEAAETCLRAIREELRWGHDRDVETCENYRDEIRTQSETVQRYLTRIAHLRAALGIGPKETP